MSDKKPTVMQLVIAGFVVIGIFGTPFAVTHYIEKRVDDHLRDPQVIREFASRIRPSVIFDSDETILHDNGAMQYLDSFEVFVNEEKNGKPPITIIVKPKEHLAYAPLIDAFGQNGFSSTARRGKGNEWIIDLGVKGFTFVERPSKFRLEILQ